MWCHELYIIIDCVWSIPLSGMVVLMIGTFERNILGRFIYRTDKEYLFFRAQGMIELGRMPRSFNIWQMHGMIAVWIMAKGW